MGIKVFLLLMATTACAQQPTSATQCLKGSDGLGCIAPMPNTPNRIAEAILSWRGGKAIFSQSLENGSCLYKATVPASKLMHEYVDFASLRSSKAMTEYSVVPDDLLTALKVQYVAKKAATRDKAEDAANRLSCLVNGKGCGLVGNYKCSKASYLYNNAADVFRRGNFEQQREKLSALCSNSRADTIIDIATQESDKLSDTLQVAENIFSGSDRGRAVVYHAGLNLGLSFLTIVRRTPKELSLVELNKRLAVGKQVKKINKVLGWLRSKNASYCQKTASFAPAPAIMRKVRRALNSAESYHF